MKKKKTKSMDWKEKKKTSRKKKYRRQANCLLGLLLLCAAHREQSGGELHFFLNEIESREKEEPAERMTGAGEHTHYKRHAAIEAC